MYGIHGIVARAKIQLLGVQEVAAIAGVKSQAVANWRSRYPDFPRPVAELSTGPVFNEPEVRRWLTKAKPQAQPPRLSAAVEAGHLIAWADRRTAQAELPRLLRRLVCATVRTAQRVDFPAGDAVQKGGWDGVVESASVDQFVPLGCSAWELSTQKDSRRKAEREYVKRKRDPRNLEPSKTTFVFVTPRRWWKGKREWIDAKRREGFWADVNVYDADDLEQWIEMAPSVQPWVAALVGAQRAGLRTAEQVWEAWSSRTEPPLSIPLITAGREEMVERIRSWLAAPPAALALRAESREEALAFGAATILSLSLSGEEWYAHLARTVVVDRSDLWFDLIHGQRPVVLVAAFDDAESIPRAIERGHHVLLPLDLNAMPPRDAVRLPQLGREKLAAALQEIGLRGDDAKRVARESAGRSDVLVRRLNRVAGVALPPWARPGAGRTLAPFRLAGAWDDYFAADRAVVGRLAHRQPSEVEDVLKSWEHVSDTPIRLDGKVWHWCSPEDSWDLLAPYLTETDLAVLRQVSVEVLGAHDPRCGVSPDERRVAPLTGKVSAYSDHLRHGLANTLALMATRGVEGATSGQDWANLIITDLFHDAHNWRLWASLSQLLPTLAEAAPEVFLNAVRSLVGTTDALRHIFAEEGLSGGSPHTGLLWALETLAWRPEYLSQVTCMLGELAAFDPGGRLANRPIRSLREIFLGWCPQTTASLESRIEALDVLSAKQSGVGWELMLSLLVVWAGDTAFPTHRPRWREWLSGWDADAASGSFWATVEAAGDRLIRCVGTDVNRWVALIPKLASLMPQHRDAAVVQLVDLAGRQALDNRVREVIRELLHRHRSFPDAKWALPPDIVDQLGGVYETLEPTDSTGRFLWLFSAKPGLPNPPEGGWRQEEEALKRARIDAMTAILELGGVAAVREFVEVIEPAYVHLAAAATIEANTREDIIFELLDSTLGSQNPTLRTFGVSLVNASFLAQNWTWVANLLSTRANTWNEPHRVDFACGLPFEGRTWDLVASWGTGAEHAYWRSIGPGFVADVENDGRRALEQLLGANRPQTALRVAAYAVHGADKCRFLPTRLLARVLQQVGRDNLNSEEGGRTDGMLEYHVQQVLEIIKQAGDIDRKELIDLEWLFLPLLRWGDHQPTALHQALVDDPKFFASVVSLVYRREGDVDQEPEIPSDQAARSERAWDLLRSWATMPGTKDDGTADPEYLRTWVIAAREACSSAGRAAVGDQEIGQALAHAPIGADGGWPHEAVRIVLREVNSREIETGLLVGVLNKRGVHWRSITDGGAQEREIAARYWNYAGLLQGAWPETAAILRRIAQCYETDARREDLDTSQRLLE